MPRRSSARRPDSRLSRHTGRTRHDVAARDTDRRCPAGPPTIPSSPGAWRRVAWTACDARVAPNTKAFASARNRHPPGVRNRWEASLDMNGAAPVDPLPPGRANQPQAVARRVVRNAAAYGVGHLHSRVPSRPIDRIDLAEPQSQAAPGRSSTPTFEPRGAQFVGRFRSFDRPAVCR